MRLTNGMKPARDTLPLKRATEAEKEERIVQTMRLVIMGYSTADVKQWFRSTLDIKWCQALRYLRLAREWLAEETGLTDEFTLNDMKVQHYCIAMQVVRNVDAPARDRLAALKLAGAMYGIGTANNVAPPTTSDGARPYSATKEALRQCSVEELEILQKVRNRADAITQNRNSGSN